MFKYADGVGVGLRVGLAARSDIQALWVLAEAGYTPACPPQQR